MTRNRPRPSPNRAPRTLAEQDARHAREAAALRANLHRRKAQARARQDPGAPADTLAELPDSTDLR